MKKLICVLLVFAFVGYGCPNIGGMDCEPDYELGQCTDGSYPQVCVSQDGSRCGYKIKGQYIYCAACFPVLDCFDAASDAVALCFGYFSPESVDELDESTIEMQVEELVDALEFFKETIMSQEQENNKKRYKLKVIKADLDKGWGIGVGWGSGIDFPSVPLLKG